MILTKNNRAIEFARKSDDGTNDYYDYHVYRHYSYYSHCCYYRTDSSRRIHWCYSKALSLESRR